MKYGVCWLITLQASIWCHFRACTIEQPNRWQEYNATVSTKKKQPKYSPTEVQMRQQISNAVQKDQKLALCLRKYPKRAIMNVL